MINNVKFGKMAPSKIQGTWYTWDSNSGTALISSDSIWLSYGAANIGEDFLESIIGLSHETLHKVLFKMDELKATSYLDKLSERFNNNIWSDGLPRWLLIDKRTDSRQTRLDTSFPAAPEETT